jgi:hypothetical protein
MRKKVSKTLKMYSCLRQWILQKSFDDFFRLKMRRVVLIFIIVGALSEDFELMKSWKLRFREVGLIKHNYIA